MSKRVPSWSRSTQQPDTEGGFSLVELMLSLVSVVLTLILLQSTLFSAVKTRVSSATQDHRNDMAYDLMQRLTICPFGTAVDPAASGSQLTEFFDDDQDLGSVTLKGLETAAGTPGHTFTTSLDGISTAWRVAVSNDLDGDGLTTGFREGRSDLLRIEVFAQSVLMFRTVRTADFPNTSKD